MALQDAMSLYGLSAYPDNYSTWDSQDGTLCVVQSIFSLLYNLWKNYQDVSCFKLFFTKLIHII